MVGLSPARVDIDRIVFALQKAGFEKLDQKDVVEFLAELPMLLKSPNGDARVVAEFAESGYAYGYTVHVEGPCVGCFDVYVVIIHRGYDTANDEDYAFAGVDVYHKCFGDHCEG